MYKDIESIRPYFYSLRELENRYFSLDFKIPVSWVYEQFIPKTEDVSHKIQDKSAKTLLISIIGLASKEGYSKIFKIAEDIIKYNMEEEEKNKLLNMKIKELETLFSTKSLEELKDININEVIINGCENNEEPNLAGEGN